MVRVTGERRDEQISPLESAQLDPMLAVDGFDPGRPALAGLAAQPPPPVEPRLPAASGGGEQGDVVCPALHHNAKEFEARSRVAPRGNASFRHGRSPPARRAPRATRESALSSARGSPLTRRKLRAVTSRHERSAPANASASARQARVAGRALPYPWSHCRIVRFRIARREEGQWDAFSLQKSPSLQVLNVFCGLQGTVAAFAGVSAGRAHDERRPRRQAPLKKSALTRLTNQRARLLWPYGLNRND